MKESAGFAQRHILTFPPSFAEILQRGHSIARTEITSFKYLVIALPFAFLSSCGEAAEEDHPAGDIVADEEVLADDLFEIDEPLEADEPVQTGKSLPSTKTETNAPVIFKSDEVESAVEAETTAPPSRSPPRNADGPRLRRPEGDDTERPPPE